MSQAIRYLVIVHEEAGTRTLGFKDEKQAKDYAERRGRRGDLCQVIPNASGIMPQTAA